MVGIDIKGIDSDDGTEGRIKLKTNLINQHLINELDKIGLQLINIKATFNGKVVVTSRAKGLRSERSNSRHCRHLLT